MCQDHFHFTASFGKHQDESGYDNSRQSLPWAGLQRPHQCKKLGTNTSLWKKPWFILVVYFQYYSYFCFVLPSFTTSYTFHQSMLRDIIPQRNYNSRHLVVNRKTGFIAFLAAGGGITEMQPLKTSQPSLATSSGSANSTPRDLLLPLWMEEIERMAVGSERNTANNKKNFSPRPKNRPQSVPGATGKATAIKQMLDLNSSSSSSRLPTWMSDSPKEDQLPPNQSYPYPSSNSEIHHHHEHLYHQQANDGVKRKRGRPRKHAIKDGEDAISTTTVSSLHKKRKTLVISPSKNKRGGTTAITALVLSTKRGRASKVASEYSTDTRGAFTSDTGDVPPQQIDIGTASSTSTSSEYFSDGTAAATLKLTSKQPSSASGKYYRSELLKSADEYSLGMKARFLMCCEEVYLGLSAELERLPTMVEWAEACHFGATANNETLNFESLEDAPIRPSGSAYYFPTQEELEREARMFIGAKGLGRKGPGRGKGRQRKKPRKLSLDIVKLKLEVEKIFPEIVTQSYNRNDTEATRYFGSPQDFVDVMLAARSAKQQMVESNMRLVISIARRYQNIEGIGISDLVQEGSMGLMRAVEKFDPTKGFKFSTYASW